jgi:prepilin-type N-terminal cleavage/methylation domain-containing protein
MSQNTQRGETDMQRRSRFGSKAGVTLIELMVVLLIATILVIAMLPLFAPMVEEAKYTAEAKPVLSAVRTKVELYRYEHVFLPGVLKTGEGIPDPITAGGNTNGSSLLPSRGGGIVQGFMPTITSGDITTYTPSSSPATQPLAWVTQGVDTVMSDLGLDYQDFSGKKMKPSHFQYRSDQAGVNNGAYWYVVGIFGGGAGGGNLSVGTGFAVVEIVNPSANVKVIGTWQRYKVAKNLGGQSQIVIANSSERPSASADNAKDTGDVCWIPANSAVMSTLSPDVATALTEMKKAGWEF